MARTSKKGNAQTTTTTEVVESAVVGTMEVTTEVANLPAELQETAVVVETSEQEVPSSNLLGTLVQNVVEAPKPDAAAEAMAVAASKKVEKNSGVGIFVKHLIAEGKTNKEIVAICKEQYGNDQTTYACVAWYRNKMKKAGVETKNKAGLDFVKKFAMLTGATDQEASAMQSEIIKQVA